MWWNSPPKKKIWGEIWWMFLIKKGICDYYTYIHTHIYKVLPCDDFLSQKKRRKTEEFCCISRINSTWLKSWCCRAGNFLSGFCDVDKESHSDHPENNLAKFGYILEIPKFLKNRIHLYSWLPSGTYHKTLAIWIFYFQYLANLGHIFYESSFFV